MKVSESKFPDLPGSIQRSRYNLNPEPLNKEDPEVRDISGIRIIDFINGRIRVIAPQFEFYNDWYYFIKDNKSLCCSVRPIIISGISSVNYSISKLRDLKKDFGEWVRKWAFQNHINVNITYQTGEQKDLEYKKENREAMKNKAILRNFEGELEKLKKQPSNVIINQKIAHLKIKIRRLKRGNVN